MNPTTRLSLIALFFLAVTVLMMDCGRRMKQKRAHPVAAPPRESAPSF